MKQYLSRSWIIAWNKLTRPWCTGNPNGSHTMVEYGSRDIKECVDCNYTEVIYSKRN